MARGESLLRQWNLLKTLQARRFGAGIEELSKQLECSPRQIHRDLNLLQESGFPINFEQREFGKRFWRLSANFVESDKFIFSITEMVSLYLSHQLLSPLAGTELGNGLKTLLDKIKAYLPTSALRHFERMNGLLLVKNPVCNDYSAHAKTIRILNEGIFDCGIVQLSYNSISKKKVYATEFHPYGMIFFNGNLYCVGYLQAYQEIRTLKVDRIAAAQLSGKSFRRPVNFSLQNYTESSFGIFTSGKPEQVRIALSGWAAANVRGEMRHPSQRIVADDGDQLTVEFHVSCGPELKRWVLGFGRRATVLSPASLAQEVADECNQVIGLYQGKKKIPRR